MANQPATAGTAAVNSPDRTQWVPPLPASTGRAMTRQLAPRQAQLAGQVLAALRRVDTMTTPEVARAVGQDPHRLDTWRALDWCERQGSVERAGWAGAAVVWRATVPAPAVEPVDLDALTTGGAL